MCSKKNFALLSVEQQAALKAFNREVAQSNGRQGSLGKRVPFNEKSFSVQVNELETETYTNPKTKETVSAEYMTFFSAQASPKESLVLKIAKDTWN